MAKQVRETNAAGAISAKVIFNKKGEHVATVQAHHASAVTVDVWQESRAIDNCVKRPDIWAKLPAGQDYKVSAWDLLHFQQGRAGGGGYDKYAAALAGLIIDGHTMADHCGRVPEAEKSRVKLLNSYVRHFSAKRAPGAPLTERDSQKYWDERAERIGASFANYDLDKGHYRSLFFFEGLRRLEVLGYQVINAI